MGRHSLNPAPKEEKWHKTLRRKICKSRLPRFSKKASNKQPGDRYYERSKYYPDYLVTDESAVGNSSSIGRINTSTPDQSATLPRTSSCSVERTPDSGLYLSAQELYRLRRIQSSLLSIEVKRYHLKKDLQDTLSSIEADRRQRAQIERMLRYGIKHTTV